MSSKLDERVLRAALSAELSRRAQAAPEFEAMWRRARTRAVSRRRRSRAAVWAVAAMALLAATWLLRPHAESPTLSRWRAPTDVLLQYSLPPAWMQYQPVSVTDEALRPAAIWDWQPPTAGLLSDAAGFHRTAKSQTVF